MQLLLITPIEKRLTCLYIEVPNINDALLKLYDVEDYHRFHFFKDHLHYFSRMSLQETIRQAGVQEVTISGHSRFGLANHLYWLKEGRPGGHMIWNFLETPSLFREYARALAAADWTRPERMTGRRLRINARRHRGRCVACA